MLYHTQHSRTRTLGLVTMGKQSITNVVLSRGTLKVETGNTSKKSDEHEHSAIGHTEQSRLLVYWDVSGAQHDYY